MPLRQAAASTGQCMAGKVWRWTFSVCVHSPVLPQIPSKKHSAPGSWRMHFRPHHSAVQADGDVLQEIPLPFCRFVDFL